MFGVVAGVPEADQRVGAEAHQFPTDEQQQQIIGHHQQQHRAAEEAHVGEEAGQQWLFGHVVLWLALVLAQAVAPVVVADAVDEDHRRGEGDHQEHDRPQRVDGHAHLEPLPLIEVAQRQPVDGAGDLLRVFFQGVEAAAEDVEGHRPAHDERADDGDPGDDPTERAAAPGEQGDDEESRDRQGRYQPGQGG